MDRIQDFFERISAKVEMWHEENSSGFGYKIRRYGYYLTAFVLESIAGIGTILLVSALAFFFCWYMAIVFACEFLICKLECGQFLGLYGLLAPGTPLIFPVSCMLGFA
jgi:ABC-type multidrug transport system permease subunit